MTLPRRLVLAEDGLRTPPIEKVETLRRELLAEGAEVAAGVGIPTGQAEIFFGFAAPGAAFRIDFEHPSLEIAIESNGDDLRLIVRPLGDDDAPRYVAKGARAADIRIFLDIGSIEVFAGHGRWTATKRLPSSEPVRRVGLGPASQSPRAAQVWRLEAGAARAAALPLPVSHVLAGG